MKYVKAFIFPLLFLGISALLLKISYDAALIAPKGIPFSEKLAETAKKNQKNTDAAKETEVSNVSLEDLTKAKQHYEETIQEELIGEMTAPSVNLTLPILREATDETLSIGAAQYFTDRKMGKGNYTIASHNFYGAPVLMYNIKDLKEGDVVEVTDFEEVFQYEVTENKVISETQIEVVENSYNPILTLLRCEGGANTPYRRLVQAKLVKREKLKEKPKEILVKDGSLTNISNIQKDEKSQQESVNQGTPYQQFLQNLRSEKWFESVLLKIGEIFSSKTEMLRFFALWFIVFAIVVAGFFWRFF